MIILNYYIQCGICTVVLNKNLLVLLYLVSVRTCTLVHTHQHIPAQNSDKIPDTILYYYTVHFTAIIVFKFQICPLSS